MNEKAKAQALSRARTVQPNESSRIKEAQEVIEENCKIEAQLYEARGHGGYIDSEVISALRETIDEQVEVIEKERRSAQ